MLGIPTLSPVPTHWRSDASNRKKRIGKEERNKQKYSAGRPPDCVSIAVINSPVYLTENAQDVTEKRIINLA